MRERFWTEVEQAYFEALPLDDAGRNQFLTRVYADRPDIRQEVASLLKHEKFALSIEPAGAAIALNLLTNDEDLVGDLIGGRYRIRERIATTSMSEVYVADHITLNYPFALKRRTGPLPRSSEHRNQLLDEARRSVLLRHENIARVHDVVEQGDDIFVVMELIEGETLRARLDRIGRPLTVREFLPIALQTTSALAAAHERQIAHLDVKPANIMLTESDQVKVCDFGIARRFVPTTPSTDEAPDRWQFAGTVPYMAPEVILSGQFDTRADLFSLGIVFYEMLAGQNPFMADSSLASSTRIVTETPEPVSTHNSEVKPQLERIITKLLAKEPDQRYVSAKELVEKLRSVERSQNFIGNTLQIFAAAFTESRLIQLCVPVLLIIVVAFPLVRLFGDRIELLLKLNSLPEKKNVVVLPFRTTSGDDRDRALTAGLTQAVTTGLSQFTLKPFLQVTPSASVTERRVENGRDARREFGANLIVMASVTYSTSEIRAIFGLYEPSSNRQLRGDTVIGHASDLFAFRQALILKIADALEVQGPTLPANAQKPSATGAYEFYTQGMGLLSGYEREAIDKAITQFLNAIAADRSYSDAYSGVGQAYWMKYRANHDPTVLEAAANACEQAIKLNSASAAAHECLGTVLVDKGQFESAIIEFERSLEFDPTSDSAYGGLGRAYDRLQNDAAAEAMYRKAIQLRPHYWAGYHWLGRFYMYRSRYVEAAEQYQQAVTAASDNFQAYLGLGANHLYAGRYGEAISALQRANELRPTAAGYSNLATAYMDFRLPLQAVRFFERAVQLDGSNYIVIGNLARAYYWTPGFREQGLAKFREAISLASKVEATNPRDADAQILLARYHAMVNNRVEALDHLHKAQMLRSNDPEGDSIAAVIYNHFGDTASALEFLEKSARGGYSISEIRAELDLDNLRGNPRFDAILAGKTTGR